MAYALASFVRLCLLDGAAARVLIQPVERALFDEAKAAAQAQLGDEYTLVHDATMAEPLVQALRQGNVFAEARRS
ncbi:MAG TPA: hypothetical protein VFJ11_08825 [Gaiellaceae bacterium]|jgi:hypothetical protein|nr:hypothetical protein [Gaiellaceae bacterium]